MDLQLRPGTIADRSAVGAFLARHGSARVARLGELVDPQDHSLLLATEGDELVGVVTYIVEGHRCEILTLHAEHRWRGAGTALIAEVERVARQDGCTLLCLITTNDNIDALRFFQRRGFRLVELRAGAVNESRVRLKPEIPTIGDHGIPLRDELVLVKDL